MRVEDSVIGPFTTRQPALAQSIHFIIIAREDSYACGTVGWRDHNDKLKTKIDIFLFTFSAIKMTFLKVIKKPSWFRGRFQRFHV